MLAHQESPGEIKSREVVLAHQESPGEIKRREVVLAHQESPGEIKSREVELGSESWTSFASVVPQQQCYGHCPCDSAPHSSSNNNCGVHWLLHNGEMPTVLTELLF